MQTFLPYKSFEKSAQCLDTKRLGKQRVEAVQILNTLLGFSAGWRNHPAVKMWCGHEGALLAYTAAVCDEWLTRGYKNTECGVRLASITLIRKTQLRATEAPPVWLGDRKFHASHRSNLLRKDAEWYGKFKWKEPADLPYVWPI